MRLLCLFSLLASLGLSQSTDWQAGVVRVSAKDRSPGTGFVVAVRAGRAYIVTCAHVVEGDPKPRVTFHAAPEDAALTAEVRDLQGGRMDGLALLVVDRAPANVRAFDATAAGTGADVTVAGYPVSLGTFSVFRTTISTVKGTELYLQQEAKEGLSGGPVILNGRVVGVMFGRQKDGRAIPSEIVRIYLRGLDVSWGDGAPATGLTAGAQRENARDGLTYVWIPPGKFMMGCSPGDTECFGSEKPPREVTIPRGFWIGQTEVTQAAFEKVMGTNPSRFQGAQRPAQQVDWNQAGSYCAKVGLRLPTEPEWEYAACAGNGSARYGELNDIAWYGKNSDAQTHAVREKAPNAWGVYDMLGNVWEWTSDLYPGTSDRVLRGGSWGGGTGGVRASIRDGVVPTRRNSLVGFRCVGELR